jgi:hypothetical protein
MATTQTPMRKLPQHEIWQTVDSMVGDLKSAFLDVTNLSAGRKTDEAKRQQFLLALSKVRCLSEEILRWELL